MFIEDRSRYASSASNTSETEGFNGYRALHRLRRRVGGPADLLAQCIADITRTARDKLKSSLEYELDKGTMGAGLFCRSIAKPSLFAAQ
ncbi:hypothetical protein [Nocardia sp. NPDC004260]